MSILNSITQERGTAIGLDAGVRALLNPHYYPILFGFPLTSSPALSASTNPFITALGGLLVCRE
jgi:hypothetical protein